MELDAFFDRAAADHPRPSVSKSAFFQARQHLSHHAFIDLNDALVDTVFAPDSGLGPSWKGHRLCAIDGTTLRLPNTPEIVSAFGVHGGNKAAVACPLALGSVFYDVDHQLILDAALLPVHTPEREAAAIHLERSQPRDLILYDRGYGGFWFYALHRHLARSFCLRATLGVGGDVATFAASGLREDWIEFRPNAASVRTCRKKGLDAAPIRLRLVRVDLPGETEVLVTNLLDAEAYPALEFKALYHRRWGVEEAYKRLKHWAEIENFSGRSLLSVEQDFYAKIVAINLCALVRVEAQRKVDAELAHRRRRYQVNFARALSSLKHRMVVLIRSVGTALTTGLHAAVDQLSRYPEAVRPDRSYPRRLIKLHTNTFHAAYKRAL